MPPRRQRNPSTNTNSDGRDNPWELEELRAQVNAMRNEIFESQREHPPSYRNSAFPATASLETAVFSPGPGQGRLSRSQRDGTPPRPANSHRRAVSRDESVASGSDYGTISSQTVSYSTPSTPSRNHGRSGVRISRRDLVTVNVYGPTGNWPLAGLPHAGAVSSGPPPPPAPTVPSGVASGPPPPAPTVPSGVASGPPPAAPPAATAPPQVPRLLIYHEPVPRSVRASGVPSHLTTPLRYRMPIPLIRPPNAHTQDIWYLVTIGYGTGVFRLILARLLTRNTGRFNSTWNGVSGGWEAARDAYEESYIAGAVELIPCPDAVYQRALQHSLS